MRRLSSSLSSCLDSAEALLEDDPSATEHGEAFVRDGGSERAIFLGGNGKRLGDKGVTRVVEGLEDPSREYYKLYLCDNRIGWRGASIVSHALTHNTSLVEMSLGNNRIGDEGARHLASALVHNATLEMLDLENNGIGPAGTVAIANALERDNNSLQWLVLSENPIGDEGAQALLRCIANTTSLDHLQKSNHSLLSIILKKVAWVKDAAFLRKIRCYLKINRLSVPCTRFAVQRKVLLGVKESPQRLMEFCATLREENPSIELGLQPYLLSLLGYHSDLSTAFVVLQNAPHLFSDDRILQARRSA